MMNKDKPNHFNTLRKTYPAYFAALEQLGETVQAIGPLDARTCHLIQLGAAATNRSEGAVHSHARRAAEAGATREEINHAVLSLTSTIGFPAVSAALSWIDDLDELADG
jgi:4-carboxymuconolactone decarboxylase